MRSIYVPKHFEVSDRAKVRELIERNPFGILVSNVDGRPFASHVPFVILDGKNEDLVLGTHVARANPQWNGIESQEVLAIFTGAHAHISGAWYADPGSTVPTWNYAAVHCLGRAKVLDNRGARRVLGRLVDENEGEAGWTMQTAPAGYIERQLGAIVALELTVQKIEATFKYSQNRTQDDRSRVIQHLRESPQQLSGELARDMAAFYEDGER